eukprot:TRINITY_DN6525_c0_g1_i10.p1 TRINITY_DN6525_c0_g1~~TRINITY_DN6525_c0_g1_i10.p1  ORF type:complete len:370 (+),score=29.00 TRINITY_DN6525_c0_g1_i10:338-1447(+)
MIMTSLEQFFMFVVLLLASVSCQEDCPYYCNNDPPPPGARMISTGIYFTCEEQRDYGKCGEYYMQGFCECTCGTCQIQESPPPTPYPLPPIANYYDYTYNSSPSPSPSPPPPPPPSYFYSDSDAYSVPPSPYYDNEYEYAEYSDGGTPPPPVPVDQFYQEYTDGFSGSIQDYVTDVMSMGPQEESIDSVGYVLAGVQVSSYESFTQEAIVQAGPVQEIISPSPSERNFTIRFIEPSERRAIQGADNEQTVIRIKPRRQQTRQNNLELSTLSSDTSCSIILIQMRSLNIDDAYNVYGYDRVMECFNEVAADCSQEVQSNCCLSGEYPLLCQCDEHGSCKNRFDIFSSIRGVGLFVYLDETFTNKCKCPLA